MMDTESTDAGSSYTHGATAQRTVIGQGTNWDLWALDMKFKLDDDSGFANVLQVRDVDHLYLTDGYEGANGLAGYGDYSLLPWTDRYYYSELGNPFKWEGDATTPYYQDLPTENSDAVTAIQRVGQNIAIFMASHTWMIDGVNITDPQMISNFWGAENAQTTFNVDDSVAFFTGKEMAILSGGQVRSLDPQERVKPLIATRSQYAEYPHGLLYEGEGTKLLMWWIGLNSSRTNDYAFVLDVKSGRWWTYYHKDVACAIVANDSVANRPTGCACASRRLAAECRGAGAKPVCRRAGTGITWTSGLSVRSGNLPGNISA
jgi:hypothetical protein